MFKRILMLGPAALLAAACGSERPHPTDPTVAFSAVKFWEAGATVRWNELATDLAVAAPAPGINATRLYAYLALAQFRAAEAAQAAPGPHRPIAAAIGGASVAVLSSFFPSASTQLEAALDAQQGSDPWRGAQRADFTAGEAIGRAVGGRSLPQAATRSAVGPSMSIRLNMVSASVGWWILTLRNEIARRTGSLNKIGRQHWLAGPAGDAYRGEAIVPFH